MKIKEIKQIIGIFVRRNQEIVSTAARLRALITTPDSTSESFGELSDTK